MSSRLPDEVRRTDVVVIGAGAAGLSAALASDAPHVTVLTAAAAGTGGSTPLAQGGIAAAIGEDDTPHLHADDTIGVSGGLADAEVVTAVTAGAPAAIESLRRLGVRFDTETGGRPALGREAAHSRRRILHSDGDATGREIARGLSAAVDATPTIQVVHDTRALELLVEDGRVVGVLAQEADGRVVAHVADAVVMATGGVGGLYARTTNPPEVWGSGLALAVRAGARLVDLEFVQFHPTALAVAGGTRAPLITEALRGEGASLVDGAGRPLLAGVHPDGDLAPRDIVARTLWRALRSGTASYLDARRQMADPAAFPTVRALCLARDLDPSTQPIPVAPAAHYHMGGIFVDSFGRTDLPGLWACGEVASTGMHGANRLASNSLLEAVWAGMRVAERIGTDEAPRRRSPAIAAQPTPSDAPAVADSTIAEETRRIVWEGIGIERDRLGLRDALHDLASLEAELGPGVSEAHDRILVARMLATAASVRTESRGAHHRTDHPAADPRWRSRILVSLEEDTVRTTTVPLTSPAGAVA